MASSGLRAGELDRRIGFLRAPVEDDGFQQVEGAPAPQFTRWAKATPVRDGEKFAGGEMQASLAYRFLVRWDAQTATVDPTWLVQFEGRTYGVAGVKEALGRRVAVEITAAARAESLA